jgi:hypothetical protein
MQSPDHERRIDMPELKNPAWEAFAQGRARGLSLKGAYIAAGYSAKSSSGPASVHAHEEVKTRIEELVKQHALLHEANLEETIVALLDLAAKIDSTTAAGAKEARASRLEAHRLNGLLAARREDAAWTPPRQMTEAEWDAKYGPNAPGSGY